MAFSKILVNSFQFSALAMAVSLAGCGGGNNMLPDNNGSSTQNTPTTVIEKNGSRLDHHRTW